VVIVTPPPVDIPPIRGWLEFVVTASLAGWTWFFQGLSPAGAVAVALSIVVGGLNVLRHVQRQRDRAEFMSVNRPLLRRWRDYLITRPSDLKD
jgi:hypothetical protein